MKQEKRTFMNIQCMFFFHPWQGSQIVPRTPLALLPLGEKDKQDVLLRFVF